MVAPCFSNRSKTINKQLRSAGCRPVDGSSNMKMVSETLDFPKNLAS